MTSLDLTAAWVPIFLEPGDAVSIPVSVPSGYESATWAAAVYRSAARGTPLLSVTPGVVGQDVTISLTSAQVAGLLSSGSSRFSGHWELTRTVSSSQRTWLKGDIVVDANRTVPSNGTQAVTVTISSGAITVAASATGGGGGGGTPDPHASTHRSNGTDPIPAATTTIGGLMSAADKTTFDAVTSIATARILGNISGSTGAPTALTAAQVKTFLAIVAGDVSGLGALAALSAVGSAQITDGSIVDADVNGSAALALTKLAAIADQRLLGNVSGSSAPATALTAAQVKTFLAIASGDVSGLGTLATLSAVASAQITDGTIVDGDINGSAAIALTKLATVADQRILGNVSGSTATASALSAAQVKTFLALAISDVASLQSSLDAKANLSVSTNSQSGTTYTLVLGDAGLVVELNNASAITLTVPANSSVAFPVGTVLELYQQGAGQVTVAAAGGVTLRAPGGAKTRVQYSTVSLRKRATDEWVVTGDSAT